uniref:Uncharacterized protein n=1 Tax=Ananas comosus var. bracteatus TaxID=296719 RepID=A0A6V7PMA6_ANACO|nr:unnamed protein product [Ananas comosus var. bracteatus]
MGTRAAPTSRSFGPENKPRPDRQDWKKRSPSTSFKRTYRDVLLSPGFSTFCLHSTTLSLVAFEIASFPFFEQWRDFPSKADVYSWKGGLAAKEERRANPHNERTDQHDPPARPSFGDSQLSVGLREGDTWRSAVHLTPMPSGILSKSATDDAMLFLHNAMLSHRHTMLSLYHASLSLHYDKWLGSRRLLSSLCDAMPSLRRARLLLRRGLRLGSRHLPPLFLRRSVERLSGRSAFHFHFQIPMLLAFPFSFNLTPALPFPLSP